MEAIIINNKVTLVDDFTNVKMTIIVPKRNLQNMRELTSCKIIAKEPTSVGYNNYAGDIFNVTILVRFANIRQYLNLSGLTNVENVQQYIDLLYSDTFWGHVNLLRDKINLYAFGNCHIMSSPDNNTIYYNLEGRKHSFVKRDLNDFGKKRYIYFKGHFWSNRQF
jgi:hypothetical protein